MGFGANGTRNRSPMCSRVQAGSLPVGQIIPTSTRLLQADRRQWPLSPPLQQPRQCLGPSLALLHLESAPPHDIVTYHCQCQMGNYNGYTDGNQCRRPKPNRTGRNEYQGNGRPQESPRHSGQQGANAQGNGDAGEDIVHQDPCCTADENNRKDDAAQESARFC